LFFRAVAAVADAQRGPKNEPATFVYDILLTSNAHAKRVGLLRIRRMKPPLQQSAAAKP